MCSVILKPKVGLSNYVYSVNCTFPAVIGLYRLRMTVSNTARARYKFYLTLGLHSRRLLYRVQHAVIATFVVYHVTFVNRGQTVRDGWQNPTLQLAYLDRNVTKKPSFCWDGRLMAPKLIFFCSSKQGHRIKLGVRYSKHGSISHGEAPHTAFTFVTLK